MPATELSKRLTKIREERGYKRTELAETLGIPYRTITNYETGERETVRSNYFLQELNCRKSFKNQPFTCS